MVNPVFPNSNNIRAWKLATTAFTDGVFVLLRTSEMAWERGDP
jgi:hypothetical protein